MVYKKFFPFFFIILSFAFSLFSDESAYIQVTSYVSQNPTSGKGSYMKFETTDQQKDVEISKDRTKITFLKPGLYFLNLSIQCGSNDFGATGYVDCWFEKNGKPLEGSTTRSSVDSQDSTQSLSTSSIEKFDANDQIAIIFSASGPGVGIISFIQQSRPSVSSAELVAYKLY